MKKIDRKAFFSAYRAAFGRVTQPQVDGLQRLLSFFETDPHLTDVRHASYMLATVKHECADTWEPVMERGGPAYFAKYDAGTPLGLRLGNTQRGDGARFPGRGYAQITGKDNYLRIGRALGMGYSLVTHPESALEPGVAYSILSGGMRLGLFTGRKLSHYITADACDYVGARRIINGTDKAQLIAGYAVAFEKVLTAALRGATEAAGP